MAGVDTAIWDLRGKQAGKPVASLLGGTPGPVRAYASSMKRDITPADEADRLKALRDAHGFDAFKVRAGAEVGRNQDGFHWSNFAIVSIKRAAARFRHCEVSLSLVMLDAEEHDALLCGNLGA